MKFAQLASLSILLSAPALADTKITGAKLAFEAPAILDLVEDLENWLDERTGLPRSDIPVAEIALIEPGTDVLYEGRMTQLESTMRGLYDEESATIYLVRPWFGDTPYEKSILLHELTHHRQVSAKHWYCPQAMEWDAYRFQEDFLNDLGETGNFHWGWVVLASSCAPRDHHPD